MLTKRKIEKLSEPGLHADERTLYLKVAAGGSKSWVQRIVVNGKRHDLGLGGWPTIPLEDARNLAIANRRKVTLGENIVKPKHEAASIPTFREAAEQVITLRMPGWKEGEKRAQAWRSIFERYVYTSLGNRKVSEIQTYEIMSIVEPLWSTKHETAMKVRQRVGVVMAWAKVKAFRSDNPVEALSAGLPKHEGLRKHYKMIPHAKVGDAIKTIQNSGAYPTTVMCLEFTILCAVRPSEARLARWSEINLEEKIWTIPAYRMKAKREHRVPLSVRALAVLDEVKPYREQDHDLIFPAAQGGPLSDSTVSKLCRENGIDGVPHGLSRACFRSWCADANVERELAESCLAHVVGGVEQAYQRSDLLARRAVVLQRWCDYIGGTKKAKVVHLN